MSAFPVVSRRPLVLNVRTVMRLTESFSPGICKPLRPSAVGYYTGAAEVSEHGVSWVHKPYRAVDLIIIQLQAHSYLGKARTRR